tara:strand:+ start:8543 stop:9049 length:507 start_codon:yes stop_codon:yes gene_type:complete
MTSGAQIIEKPAVIFLYAASPYLFGVASGLLIYWMGEDITTFMLSRGWAPENLYGAVFGIVSVAAGFLLAFYAIVASAGSGVLNAIKGSTTYKRYRLTVKLALIHSLIFIIFSVPYIVAEPLPVSGEGLWAVAIWSGYTIVVFAFFWRVVASFFTLMDDDRPSRRGAG